MGRLKLFTGNANPELARRIAQHLDAPLANMVVGRFSDGEVRVQLDESSRGADAFVIQPTCGPVNETLMELLIILDALKRASAVRTTVVMPYYGYARQDKKIKPREPVTAKLVADLIQAAGADRVLAVDLHAEQIQGFFDIPVDHLYAGPLIARQLEQQGLVDGNLVVVSPDVGGVSRARALAERLKSPIVIIAKRRPKPNRSEVVEIIGEVEGKCAVMIDDMIDTGGSVAQGADALTARGAASVYACCTHAILSGNALGRLEASPLKALFVTDTIPLPADVHAGPVPVTVVSMAPLLADAIRRIHEDRSVSELFPNYR